MGKEQKNEISIGVVSENKNLRNLYTKVGGDIISNEALNQNYQTLVDMIGEVKSVRENAKVEREQQIADIQDMDDVLLVGNLFQI